MFMIVIALVKKYYHDVDVIQINSPCFVRTFGAPNDCCLDLVWIEMNVNVGHNFENSHMFNKSLFFHSIASLKANIYTWSSASQNKCGVKKTANADVNTPHVVKINRVQKRFVMFLYFCESLCRLDFGCWNNRRA